MKKEKKINKQTNRRKIRRKRHMKNRSNIRSNTCGISQGNVEIIFVNSPAGNFVWLRLSAGKSSGIPADYFPYENPQENWKFLVVKYPGLYFYTAGFINIVFRNHFSWLNWNGGIGIGVWLNFDALVSIDLIPFYIARKKKVVITCLLLEFDSNVDQCWTLI